MPGPTIQVNAGGVDFTFPLVPIDREGNQHVIQRSVEIFPRPVPDSGQPNEVNYFPYRHLSDHAPFGVGLKSQYRRNRVWDMEADARFPELVTLPRLVTTTTFPAEVAAVEFRGFTHAIGELFMWGDGQAVTETADEALLYFDGINWADSTSKDDLGFTPGSGSTGAMKVAGAVDHKGTMVVIFKAGVAQSGSPPSVFVTVAKATAATAFTAVQTTGSATQYANVRGIVSDGTDLYIPDGTTSIAIKKSTDDGATFPTTVVTINSSGVARGIAMYGDGSSSDVLDVWVTTPEGLYHVDLSASTFTLVHKFQQPQSAYSGQLIVTARGLMYTDGQTVFVGRWTNDGWVAVNITSALEDGVPLTKTGDVTGIAYDSILDQLAVVRGGLAANRQQHIMFYDFKTGLWSACMAYNATANRAAFAVAYSSETDGVNRLHFTRDNGVANDSEALYLNYISDNPEVQTAATFALAGQITRSRFNGFIHLFTKNFLKGQYLADALTSNESLSVKYATNGGALGSAQSITSGPVGELFTDGATALGTSAQDIYDEITMARAAGTNTNTPKLRALCWAWEVMGLKSDGTPLESWTVRISLNPKDYGEGMDVESPKDARDRIKTIRGTVPLVTLAIGEDAPVGSEVKVRMQPYEAVRKLGDVRDQVDLPYDEAGSVLVTFSEVL